MDRNQSIKEIKKEEMNKKVSLRISWLDGIEKTLEKSETF